MKKRGCCANISSWNQRQSRWEPYKHRQMQKRQTTRTVIKNKVNPRISRASLSMSCSARLRSACIMLWVMTAPRSCSSTLSLSSRDCRISSQWLVCRGQERAPGVTKQRK
uniref:Uncharacterized protein n=1 Tax=Paramormyrops kingsleyae TaxID=1676925 RepID=A0A3B3T1V3_9TELE